MTPARKAELRALIAELPDLSQVAVLSIATEALDALDAAEAQRDRLLAMRPAIQKLVEVWELEIGGEEDRGGRAVLSVFDAEAFS